MNLKLSLWWAYAIRAAHKTIVFSVFALMPWELWRAKNKAKDLNENALEMEQERIYGYIPDNFKRGNFKVENGVVYMKTDYQWWHQGETGVVKEWTKLIDLG